MIISQIINVEYSNKIKHQIFHYIEPHKQNMLEMQDCNYNTTSGERWLMHIELNHFEHMDECSIIVLQSELKEHDTGK